MRGLRAWIALAWQRRAPFLAAVIVATIATALVAGIATSLAAGTAAGVGVSFLTTAAGYVLTWVAAVRCWRVTRRPAVLAFVSWPLFQLAGALILATFPEFAGGPAGGHSLGFRAALLVFGLLIGPGVYGFFSYALAGAPSREQLRLQPAARADGRGPG